MITQLELPNIINELQEPWKIVVKRETDPESPRDWNNLGMFFVSPNNRYIDSELNYIGGKSFKEIENDCSSMEEMQKYIEKQGYVVLPLCVYDHSSWTVYVGSPFCRWDSGYIGFYVISKDDIRKEYDVERISSKLLKKVDKILNAEVKVFDQYVQGDVYEFVATKPGLDGEEVTDSCGGFFGSNLKEILENGMLEYLPVPYPTVEEAIQHIEIEE